jgi:hypothetical protein
MFEEVMLPFRLVQCDNLAPTIIRKWDISLIRSLLRLRDAHLRVRFKAILPWTPCPKWYASGGEERCDGISGMHTTNSHWIGILIRSEPEELTRSVDGN